MDIKETIATINQMQADGVIGVYAIGGAVGATFYLEPAATEDVDIFCALEPPPGQSILRLTPYDYLTARGYRINKEGYIVIAGWPVQFHPVGGDPLLKEALEQSVQNDFDVDQELESNTEYHRVVAALSPSEKQRFFGTAFDLQHRLSTKRAYRRALAKLSPAAKLRLLEELRKRSQQQRGSRRSAKLPVAVDGFRGVQPRPTPNKQKKRSTRAVLDAQRFGGRATAGGVNYEVRVAAFIAAKMLCGGSCSVWDGISGADIGAVTLQAPEPVDDIVVDLLSGVDARAFISAKKRSASIALTKKNPTFTGTIAAFVRQFIKLSPTARMSSRLIWAIPSAASRGATHGLASVLDTHRNEAGDDSISAFLSC